MLTPVICFTCGLPIGDVATIFRFERAKLAEAILAEKKVAPGWAPVVGELQIDCSEIFDRLGIRADCCRTHLATAMQFDDQYR